MDLTGENFAAETADGLMLVDFWAPWCGPCQAMMPVLAEFEEKTGVKVGKINVDEQGELAGQFRVMSIPTLVVMKDGKAVEQFVGGRTLQELTEAVEKHK
ncbi:thioredoxin [Candidatus Gracilibacteria bacterium]|nr:thioredoxin [Candidatus Gracilibacteria bacterium]